MKLAPGIEAFRPLGPGEKIAGGDSATGIGRQRRAQRNQAAAVPANDRLQEFYDQERTHLGMGKRGDSRVTKAEAAHDHIPSATGQFAETEVGQRILHRVKHAGHQKRLAQFYFVDDLVSEDRDPFAPQAEVTERSRLEIQLLEKGIHALTLPVRGVNARFFLVSRSASAARGSARQFKSSGPASSDLPRGTMNNLGLYLAAVLIWGSTWFAITFQLGTVPAEVSVAYRFALAAGILFTWCGVRRLRLAYSGRDHLWMAAQGALLFGFNYACVYLAEEQIASGLVAVIFSLIVFLNIIGARVFFRTPLKPATLIGAAFGVGGVALVFLPQIGQPSGKTHAALGLTYALCSVVSASFGNLVAARNQRQGLPVVQLNAFGMMYGALFVGLYALAAGRHFDFNWTPSYLLSLGYLALFGSVIAFGAYLTLIGRIGADRAGYTGAAIPIVALIMSTRFEGLHWQAGTLIGILLCVIGNVLVLRRKKSPPPTLRPAG
jgi:drug/metabolite transporter (DMT)-like permease